MIPRLLVAAVFMLVPLVARGEIESVTSTTRAARRFERVDFVVLLTASWTNPYRSAEVRLDLELETPSGGALRVPAYFEKVQQKQRVRLELIDEHATLVDDPDAVRITIRCEPDVRALGLDALQQRRKVARDRLRVVHSRKARVNRVTKLDDSRRPAFE